MPPSPVMTTNDRKTIPSTMPLAMRPDQNSFANQSSYTTSALTAIAHGRMRRHGGSPARWSSGGDSSATEPAARVRSKPRKKRSTIVRRKGMDDEKPEMSVRKSGAYPNTRFWRTPSASPAGERERYRPQAGGHDRGQRAQHHQRVVDVGEPEQRCDEHAAQPRQHHRQHPRHRRRLRHVHAAKPGELATVDAGPHLEPDARVPQHPPKEHRRRGGGKEDRQLVRVDGDAAQRAPDHLARHRAEPGRQETRRVASADRARGPSSPPFQPATGQAREARRAGRSCRRSARTPARRRAAGAKRDRAANRATGRTPGSPRSPTGRWASPGHRRPWRSAAGSTGTPSRTRWRRARS